MSSSILMARQSALADWLTSCVMMAWRLLIFLTPAILGDDDRLVQRLAQQRRQVLAPGGRPRGLPDWPFLKRVWRGGLP